MKMQSSYTNNTYHWNWNYMKGCDITVQYFISTWWIFLVFHFLSVPKKFVLNITEFLTPVCH
jgi:hypothetical protein